MPHFIYKSYSASNEEILHIHRSLSEGPITSLLQKNKLLKRNKTLFSDKKKNGNTASKRNLYISKAYIHQLTENTYIFYNVRLMDTPF